MEHETVTLRIPREASESIDRLLAVLKNHPVMAGSLHVTRTSVIRMAIVRGLASLDAEHKLAGPPAEDDDEVDEVRDGWASPTPVRR